MTSKQQFYEEVKARILETAVETCRLFNSQFDEMENEATWAFPCAFIEFTELEYRTKALGIQEAETTIRVHVGFESLKTEDFEIFDLLEAIHEKLQRFGNFELFTPLNRVFEGQDVNHDNVIVWTMDYETLLLDCSGHRDNDLNETSLAEIDIIGTAEKPWLPQE